MTNNTNTMNTEKSWYRYFVKAREEEGNIPSANWMQIATVAQDGTPRIRTVVFRGWNKERIFFFTDTRSNKCEEIYRQPHVEICYLFLESCYQFRFKGIANKSQVTFAEKCWNNLSKKKQVLWLWPEPGKNLSKKEAFFMDIKNDLMPENFIVIEVDILEVELLQIKESPHKRMLWRAKDNWELKNLNP